MADERNRRNNKKNNSIASDRVIYLNRKDIRSNSRRRSKPTATPSTAESRRTTSNKSRRGSASSRPSNGTVRQTASSAPARTRRRTADTRTSSARITGTPAPRRSSVPVRQSDTYGRRRDIPSESLRQRTVQQNTRSQRPAPRPKKSRPRVKASSGEKYIIISRYLPPVFFSCNNDAKGEKRRYKKTSRRGNNTGMIIVAAVIALLFLIYIGGYAINMSHTDKIAYETIQVGSVDSAKKADGVIIRSEKVFTAPSSGAVEYAVPENEKIRSGTVVCSISNAQAVAQLQENLDSINNDIMKLQQNRQDISEHTEEVNKLETQIKNITDENTFDFVSGDFSDVYNLKYSVENKLNTRNQLLLSENSGSLSELAGQRSNELKQINDNIKQVTSDVGGIVCYTVDGTESTFTPESAQSLTKEQIEQNNQGTGGIKTNVAANDPIFKVITSNEWYIASYMPDSYTEGWETGREMNLYLQNGVESNRTLDVTVTVLEHGEKEAYVVFKTADFMSDYMDLRNISFEIDKPKTGYKIPNTAISQQTLLKIPSIYVDADSNTVVKVTDSGDKTLEITVSGTESDENGEYSLVPVQMGYLSAGDTLKHGDQTLKADEVVTVDGVFLVNSGVTKFVKINKENSVSSGDYTVLDESKNPNIHIYDRVVQNVSNVQENQNIYE